MYTYEHRYIAQSHAVKELPPWSLSKTVKILTNQVCDKFTDHPMGFLYLADSEPFVVAPWLDMSKAQVGFEREAIPNLKRHMIYVNDDIVVSQAVCSLLDLVKDPEKACEAFRLNLLNLLPRLMIHLNPYIRMKTLLVAAALAKAPYGRVAVSQNNFIMNHLKINLKDKHSSVRAAAYELLKVLTTNWFAIDILLEKGFVVETMNAIKDNMISSEESLKTTSEEEIDTANAARSLPNLLEALENLMDGNENVRIECMRHDVFDFSPLLNHSIKDVQLGAYGVFAQVFKSLIGREGAMAHGLSDNINPKFYLEDEETQERIYSNLMFITTLPDAKKMAYQNGIAEHALALIKKPMASLGLKLAAVKTLTNLAELPQCRTWLKEEIHDILKATTNCDPNLERHLEILVNLVMWRP